MKKISVFLICAIFMVAPAAMAETSTSVSNVDVNLSGARVENNGGSSAPYSQPGPSGQIQGIYDEFQDGAPAMVYLIDQRLNLRTLDEYLRMAGDINQPMEKPVVVDFETENNDPVKLLAAQPTGEKFLGQISSKKAKFTEGNFLRICAQIIAEAKIQTGAKYGALKIIFYKEPNALGFALGSGSAKNIGNETGASVGALFGWAKAWNARYFEVCFMAFGGDGSTAQAEKSAPAQAQASAAPAQAIPLPAQADAPAPKPQAPAPTAGYSGIICEPIYFPFDEDIPLPGQEGKLRKIAEWIIANQAIIKELEFRGLRDNRASLNYNSPLGFNSSKNLMLTIISGIEKNVPENEKQIFWKVATRFRATSASNYMPTFPGDSEEAHQKNRRVELILNGHNLTPIQ